MSTASNKMIAPFCQERRRYRRVVGDGLSMLVGGQWVPVADLSLGGMRLSGTVTLHRGQNFTVLLRSEAEEVRLGHGQALVLGIDGQGARLAFTGIRYSLARLLLRHLCTQYRAYAFRPFAR